MNIFDLFYLDNFIFANVRKEFGNNFINESSLLEIFTEYVNITSRGLIEVSRTWFISTCQDIDREVNSQIKEHDKYRDRTDQEKYNLNQSLTYKYFTRHFEKKEKENGKDKETRLH